MASLSGKIQTVLGLVHPDQLGRTLTHEHLTMTFNCCYCPPPTHQAALSDGPILMENLYWLKQNPYSNKENLLLNQEVEAVREELMAFKAVGGGCIVENTTTGISRDIKTLKRLAEETGVHIVAGAGFYVDATHTPETRAMSVEQSTNISAVADCKAHRKADLSRSTGKIHTPMTLVQSISSFFQMRMPKSTQLTQVLMDEVLRGADGTSIKCGIIGEIGCSWPLTDSERKVLQATAEAQTQLGCPVNIHPGRNSDAPFQILRILQEAGADVSKTVMSHLDRTIFDEKKLLEFAELGSYLEYDLFGTELLNYQFNTSVDMPSDNDRIKMLKSLINHGYEDRIVISHDIHTKNRLVKYGGHGYSHILNNIVPKMLLRGISQESVDKILLENPKRWLTFK